MIVDTNRNTTSHLADFKRLGVTGIIRYDNRLGPRNEKQVKPAEAKAIAAAGIQLGIVYEGAGDRISAFTRDTGRADAAYSLTQLEGRGQPKGSAIYFAVDLDVSPSQVNASVIPYFHGVADSLTGSGLVIGVYGSGLVCRIMLDAGLAQLTWISCSMGWSESKKFLATNRWTLRQHVPKPVDGVDCDANDLREGLASWGGFVPFGGDVEPLPVPHDARWLQTKLNEAGAYPTLKVDGDVGPDTIHAMVQHLEKEEATS